MHTRTISTDYNGCTQENLSIAVSSSTNRIISTGYCYPAGGAYVQLYAEIYQATTASVARVDDGFMSGSVRYYFTDHLGTSRAMVQAGQTVFCYDADFYPYGGERPYTDTCPQGYKFTGKERDGESGLDNFGARYNSSGFGRFLSPDPENAGALEGDPQSWNAYAYVRNNPANLIDPTGMVYCREEKPPHDADTILICDLTDAEYAQDPGAYGGYSYFSLENQGNEETQGTEGGSSASAGCGIDLPCHFFVGFGNMTLNEDPKGALQFGAAVSIGVLLEMPAIALRGTSLLQLGVSGTRALKLSPKILRQMQQRGWTREMIDEAIRYGDSFPAQDMTRGGAAATRYIHPATGQSVVINNATHDVVHVGARGFRY